MTVLQNWASQAPSLAREHVVLGPGAIDIPPRQYIFWRMWTIREARDAAKAIDKLPPQVAEKYAFWCAIVRQSGPHGLRALKSLHDEKLRPRAETTCSDVGLRG